jgi:hypothetical protein
MHQGLAAVLTFFDYDFIVGTYPGSVAVQSLLRGNGEMKQRLLTL